MAVMRDPVVGWRILGWVQPTRRFRHWFGYFVREFRRVRETRMEFREVWADAVSGEEWDE